MCTSVRVNDNGTATVDRDGKWTGRGDSERESSTSPSEIEM